MRQSRREREKERMEQKDRLIVREGLKDDKDRVFPFSQFVCLFTQGGMPFSMFTDFGLT